jgi:hypothetical protein
VLRKVGPYFLLRGSAGASFVTAAALTIDVSYLG